MYLLNLLTRTILETPTPFLRSFNSEVQGEFSDCLLTIVGNVQTEMKRDKNSISLNIVIAAIL